MSLLAAIDWMHCLWGRPLLISIVPIRPPAQVTQQAQTGELGPGAVLEGGDTDTERRSTFLELSLALAGGLDAVRLETLYKAAKPGIQASHRLLIIITPFSE